MVDGAKALRVKVTPMRRGKLSQSDDTHDSNSGERMILNPFRIRALAVLCSLFIADIALGAAPITAVGPAEHKAALS